jgi:uncharacterized protein (TIGR02452 family)
MLTLPELVVAPLHRDDVQLPVAAAQAVIAATDNIVRRGWYLAPSQKPVLIRRCQTQACHSTQWYQPQRDTRATRYPFTHIQVHNQTLLTIGHAWHKRGYRVAVSNPLSLQYYTDALIHEHVDARGSLLRSSGIHRCLASMVAHPQEAERGMVLTPQLPVFRSYAGDLLEHPWNVDVITTDTPATPQNPYAMVNWEHDLQCWLQQLCAAAQQVGANALVVELWSAMHTSLVAQIIRTTLQNTALGGLAVIDFAIPDVTFQRVHVHPFVEVFAGLRVANAH